MRQDHFLLTPKATKVKESSSLTGPPPHVKTFTPVHMCTDAQNRLGNRCCGVWVESEGNKRRTAKAKTYARRRKLIKSKARYDE